ncbi:MAG: glycine/sarcosine/betaine reductase selenoprotein B family protein, partial [Acidimicrobiia bacterium]
ISADDLRVRHGGYDVRGARRDPNVVFPLRALHRLAAEGVIGEVAPTAFSFVGACSQAGLRHEVLPGWIERVRDERADAVLLVPV